MIEYVKLGDCFDLQMGKTPSRGNADYWDGENKWISIADIGNCVKYIYDTKECITDKGVSESGIKPVPMHTVIMSFKLSIGKTAITTEDMYTNEAIMAFIPKDDFKNKIDINYLFYWLSSKDWTAGTNKAVMGLTLNKATLSEVKMPLLPVEEQKHIADVFDKLSDIFIKRRRQLEKLDELVKARFMEMFGDPVRNTKNFKTSTLTELGDFGRGVSKHRPRNDPALLGGMYPLIQTGDIANAGLYITEFQSTYSNLGLKQSKMWKSGTLCITIAANIAKTAILTFDACFPDSVVGFLPNNNTNNIFIHFWFSFFQQILEAQAPESAQKNINLKILSELSIITPRIDLQNQFASFVQQVEKSKSQVQQSLEKLETLKKALMQEYFG